MQLQLWHLSGRAFHFGEQGLGQEEARVAWPSDSLFAALIARLALLQGTDAVQRWMRPFLDGAPPFLLSSLFPFAGEVRFFPVPMGALRPDGQPLPEGVRPKELKKVQFVSYGVYCRLLEGRSLASQYPDVKELHRGKIWILTDEVKQLPKDLRRDEEAKIWSVEKRPRVTVGRAPEASTLFHVGAMHYAKDCGLWFGVQWLKDEAALKDLFALLLADLGEAGLGAERSVGYGKAKIESEQEPLDLPDPSGGLWTTLSRYLPRPEEITALQDERAAYRIEALSGWLDSPHKRGQRRRNLNLLAEGATLATLPGLSAPFGCVEDVHPRYPTAPDENPVGHSVYRAGLALAVGYGGAS